MVNDTHTCATYKRTFRSSASAAYAFRDLFFRDLYEGEMCVPLLCHPHTSSGATAQLNLPTTAKIARLVWDGERGRICRKGFQEGTGSDNGTFQGSAEGSYQVHEGLLRGEDSFVLMPVCPSVYFSIYLSIYIYVYLTGYLTIFLSSILTAVCLCISVGADMHTKAVKLGRSEILEGVIQSRLQGRHNVGPCAKV